MKDENITKKHTKRRKTRPHQGKSGAHLSVLNSHNFSDVEDSENAFDIISKLAIKAGENASTEAKVAGLTRVYVRNYKDLVKISSNGEEVVVFPKIKRAYFYVKYKPFTVLHVIKK